MRQNPLPKEEKFAQNGFALSRGERVKLEKRREYKKRIIRDSHKFTKYIEDDEHSTSRVIPPFRWTLYFIISGGTGNTDRYVFPQQL
jgi:hypothetical protein